MESIIISVCGFIVTILILRSLGAWMFRINELIDQQKETNKLLERQYNFMTRNEVGKFEEKEIKIVLTDEEVENNELGITFRDGKNVKLSGVKSGSSCDKQGLMLNDMILKLNGEKVYSKEDLIRKIKAVRNERAANYDFVVKRKIK